MKKKYIEKLKEINDLKNTMKTCNGSLQSQKLKTQANELKTLAKEIEAGDKKLETQAKEKTRRLYLDLIKELKLKNCAEVCEILRYKFSDNSTLLHHRLAAEENIFIDLIEQLMNLKVPAEEICSILMQEWEFEDTPYTIIHVNSQALDETEWEVIDKLSSDIRNSHQYSTDLIKLMALMITHRAAIYKYDAATLKTRDRLCEECFEYIHKKLDTSYDYKTILTTLEHLSTIATLYAVNAFAKYNATLVASEKKEQSESLSSVEQAQKMAERLNLLGEELKKFPSLKNTIVESIRVMTRKYDNGSYLSLPQCQGKLAEHSSATEDKHEGIETSVNWQRQGVFASESLSELPQEDNSSIEMLDQGTEKYGQPH